MIGSNFLQSNEWAEFQKKLGRQIWRLDNTLAIKYPLPFGQSYLYCPAGPVGDVEKLKELAKREKVVFLRVEPRTGKIDLTNFIETTPVQPKQTLILDLSKSEKELLNSFHPKTRYNIRLAEKKGVKVEIKKDATVFWRLIEQTAKRDNFSSHSKDYYSKLIESDFVKIFAAEYQGKILAANLVVFFGDTATYLHGASADEDRNLMAPHLLQWSAIKEAKKSGCDYYDFWGVAPTNQPDHSWAGITRFKEGFGGQRIDYAGTWDLPIKRGWYMLYGTIKRMRRIK